MKEHAEKEQIKLRAGEIVSDSATDQEKDAQEPADAEVLAGSMKRSGSSNRPQFVVQSKGSVNPQQSTTADHPPNLPPEPADAAEPSPKTRGFWWVFTALAVLMLFSGPTVGLIRAQTLANISAAVEPTSSRTLEMQVYAGAAYDFVGQRSQKEEYLQRLLQQVKTRPDAWAQRAYVNINLAQTYCQHGNYDLGKTYAAAALADLKKVSPAELKTAPDELTQDLIYVGNLIDPDYLDDDDKNADLDMAVPLYEAALKNWDVLPGASTKSNALAMLGQAYEGQEKYELALACFKKAYELYKGGPCADSSCAITPYNAYRLLHIGTNSLELGKYQDAEEYLEQALPIIEKTWNAPGRVIYAHQSLARAKMGLHKYSEAEKHLKDGIKISRDKDNGYYWAWLHYYLAQTYREMGKYPEAEDEYKDTIRLLAKGEYEGPEVEDVRSELHALPPHQSRAKSK